MGKTRLMGYSKVADALPLWRQRSAATSCVREEKRRLAG